MHDGRTGTGRGLAMAAAVLLLGARILLRRP